VPLIRSIRAVLPPGLPADWSSVAPEITPIAHLKEWGTPLGWGVIQAPLGADAAGKVEFMPGKQAQRLDLARGIIHAFVHG
jgi:hypothetical protein